MMRALNHFKCYLYRQKITVRTDNSAVNWLHRSKDPVGQPAKWIEVIDTYDVTFQHRPCPKHGNTDALSRYPCHQCGDECNGAPPQGVKVVTRSRAYEPGWGPEDLSAEKDADPDIGTIMRWKQVWDDRPRWEDVSLETRREYYTDGSRNWRDMNGGTNWSSRSGDEKTLSSGYMEERSGLIWGRPAPSLWRNRDYIGLGCVQM